LAYVEYSILTLVIEYIEASLHEAPTLSTVELLDRLQGAARRQLAEFTRLRALGLAD
jgi:hypothetical protein